MKTRKAYHDCSLNLATRKGTNGDYLFMKDASGAYHTFVEIQTKPALRDCGGKVTGNTRQSAKALLGF